MNKIKVGLYPYVIWVCGVSSYLASQAPPLCRFSSLWLLSRFRLSSSLARMIPMAVSVVLNGSQVLAEQGLAIDVPLSPQSLHVHIGDSLQTFSAYDGEEQRMSPDTCLHQTNVI